MKQRLLPVYFTCMPQRCKSERKARKLWLLHDVHWRLDRISIQNMQTTRTFAVNSELATDYELSTLLLDCLFISMYFTRSIVVLPIFAAISLRFIIIIISVCVCFFHNGIAYTFNLTRATHSFTHLWWSATILQHSSQLLRLLSTCCKWISSQTPPTFWFHFIGWLTLELWKNPRVFYH